MREGKEYPAGVPCWVDTAQSDPEAAVRFYGGLFGWEFENRMPAGSPGGQYFVASLRGHDVAAVGSRPADPSAPAWNTYVRVDSADDTAAKVVGAGGRLVTEPFDVPRQGRMAAFTDPAGAALCVWEPKARRGADLVNEPGTWNWSNLHTRDVDGAKAFYGTVFGWDATTVDLGSGASVMWQVPGYAEVLEVDDPDLRRRQADAGVPAGFADAIGWLLPPDEQAGADTSPQWKVTFAVADTDAVAARADDLGGDVLTPPFDAGGVARIAVLRDPQGAEFTVSAYNPSS